MIVAGETADGQIILEEEIDENYEPTEQEIVEYAQWLGMDVEKEKDLLWIAREGLKAPLPEPWKPCKTPEGDVYYFNFQNGESIWDHPCDKHYKTLYQEEKAKRLKNKAEPGKGLPAWANKPKGRFEGEDSKSLSGNSLSLKKNEGNASTSSLGGPRMADPGTASGELGHSAKDPLGAVKKLAPLKSSSNSASGSDWPSMGSALGGGGKTQGAAPLAGGTVPRSSGPPAPGTPSTSQTGPPALRGVSQSEEQDLESCHQDRLREMRQLLEKEEQVAKKKLEEASEEVLVEYRRQMKAREERLKEELALSQRKQLSDLEAAHEDKVSQLKKEQRELEEQLSEQVAATKKQLEQYSHVSEQDKVDARAAALKQVEEAAVVWVETQKTSIRQQLLDKAQTEIEEEVRPLKAVRLQEALQAIDGQVEVTLQARKQELATLSEQVADQRKLLSDLERAVSDKKASLQAADAEVEACESKVPRLDAELKAKQLEMNTLNKEIASKAAEFDEVLSKLQLRKAELSETNLKLASAQEQAASVTEELQRKSSELRSVRAAASSESELLSRSVAEQAGSSVALADTTRKLEAMKSELQEVEKALARKQAELSGVTGDVAKSRAVMLTQDVSLASELRSKASAEFSDLEADLKRCRAELAVIAPELAQHQAQLQACKGALESVTAELHDKQCHAAQAAVELSNMQAELAEVESVLVTKRHQLDTVATLLVSQQKELEFETARRAITAEEAQLLEATRDRMRRAVEDEVAAERAQLLGSKLGVMRQQVEQEVTHQRTAALAAAGLPPAGPGATSAAGGAPAGQLLIDAHGKANSVSTTPDMTLRSVKSVAGAAASHPVRGHMPLDPILQKSLELLLGQVGMLPARYDQSSEDGTATGPPTATTIRQTPGARQLPNLAWNGSEGSESLHDVPLPGQGKPVSRAQLASPPQLALFELLGTAPTAATIQQARDLLRQEKRSLRERQAQVHSAITDWRTSMAAAEAEQDLSTRKQQMRLLKSVKGVLEEQAQRVNADHHQLSSLKSQLKSWEASKVQQQHLPPRLASPEPRPQPERRSVSASRALRSSLDKIGRALEDALAAAAAKGAAAAVSHSLPAASALPGSNRWASTGRVRASTTQLPEDAYGQPQPGAYQPSRRGSGRHSRASQATGSEAEARRPVGAWLDAVSQKMHGRRAYSEKPVASQEQPEFLHGDEGMMQDTGYHPQGFWIKTAQDQVWEPPGAGWSASHWAPPPPPHHSDHWQAPDRRPGLIPAHYLAPGANYPQHTKPLKLDIGNNQVIELLVRSK